MMNTQEEKMTNQTNDRKTGVTFKPITELQTEHMLDLLEKRNLPFLPDENGFCDTRAVRNALTGYEFTGINQIFAKAYLHEKGLDGHNILTFDQANKCGAGIKKDAKAFLLSFQDMDKRDENGKAKVVINHYFADSHVKRPEKLPSLWKISIYTKDSIEPRFSNPSKYLGAYLLSIHYGIGFTPPSELAAEFSQKFKEALQASPSNLFKIGRDAHRWMKEDVSQTAERAERAERAAPTHSASSSFSR
jgi:hypothetical protein